MNAIELLLDIPKRNEKRDFLIDSLSGKSITFGELQKSALIIGSNLKKLGLNKGDRLAIVLQNSTAFVKLYFACLYAGIVTVPINPVLGQKEISSIVKRSGAKLLVISAETAAQIDLKAISEAGISAKAILDGRKSTLPANIEIWKEFEMPSKNSKDFKPFDAMKPTDTMTIVYTSGTTAMPVGVEHTISDLIDNARTFNKMLNIGPENRFYGILSMTYLGGYYNLLMLPYIGQSSVVLANTFDARAALNFWQSARQWKVNTLWLVPTIMSILLEMDRGHEGEDFCRKNIRLGLVGTAPLPLQLKNDFESRYGFPLYENYGLSETLFISTNAPDFPVKESSVGKILPGIEVSIKNEKDITLNHGEEGQIHVRTPYLMKGYYENDKGTFRQFDKEDWFATGDIGMLSPEGNLFITGRKKDLIIRGGINISPAAIENVLCQHPAVSECAVVGIPHSLYGEDIAAALRLAQDQDFEKIKPELVKLCKDNLAVIKQPSHIFEIKDFPRSSSGKIQKNKVRDLLLCKLNADQVSAYQKPIESSSKQKISMVPGRIRRDFPRPDQKIIQNLKTFPVSIITDCMNRMGIMDSAIRSLVPKRPFCGPAFTVEEIEAGNLMSHIALELIKKGDVLVIDAKGTTTRSCWGGLQSLMAKERGVEAIVVNGVVRDYAEIDKLGIPVYALGTSPGGPMKGWSGNINYPLACGGVAVCPGDIVVGDDDGVVVIPKELAAALLSYCQERKAMEDKWLKRVKNGESTIDAVGLRGKIEQFGMIFED